ncbi:uncharacterized protein LOC112090984 [Morus notabilis]|uniref:uncharacterized protein LOC112090984 n=1 Tax=Morus notabilis TaxID=981085 RepID=UPI000CED36FA|nr:uncharacterized protein LOC112090984 [Morus notabilis]
MARGNNRQVQITGSSGSPSSSQMEDSSSPYFLHNGDHPGLVLVSHHLTGSNYNTWNRTRLARDIADSLLYVDTTLEIWNNLHDRFNQSNGPRIFQLKTCLTGLQQGSMDVNTYYTKLKIYWDELKVFRPIPVCRCGGMKTWLDYQHQEYVMQFLVGLNESFTQIRSQILMMDPLPPISKVFALVLQEERQRMIGQVLPPSSEPNIFSADQKPLVAASSANLSQKFKRDRPHCTHCGLQGHTVEKCYRIHGFPPRFKTKARGPQAKAQTNQVAAVSSEENCSASSEPLNAHTSNQCQQLIALLTTQL